jgi:hypothetical protein
MKAVAILCALALTGCATASKRAVVKPVEAKILVARECVPKGLAGPPAYPDTADALKAAPAAADRYQLLAAGRLLRAQRLAEIEPVIAACR